MNEAELKLAAKIVLEIALLTIQGEADVRKTMLTKYGEYGFELAEEYCKQYSNEEHTLKS